MLNEQMNAIYISIKYIVWQDANALETLGRQYISKTIVYICFLKNPLIKTTSEELIWNKNLP